MCYLFGNRFVKPSTMMGPRDETSPAPNVMMTSPGFAISIIASVASTKFGIYVQLDICSAMTSELTPAMGFSLAA